MIFRNSATPGITSLVRNQKIRCSSVKTLMLCLSILFFSSFKAQFNANSTASINYKRPHDIGRTRRISNGAGILVCTKNSHTGRHTGSGNVWRYNPAPASLVITVYSKNSPVINPLISPANYKAQRLSPR